DVRRFWRGDDGMLGLFASRICGSADIYTKSGKGPESSINFITCHDGFTLNDLVSYRYKHNEANGENNHDGTDANFSENYGAEGETTDAGIESLRKRQIKNFLLTLLISRGVPMLLGGDEFRRTQGGNNNAYCQDNETSWHDWSCLEQHRETFRFAGGMIAFRRAHPILSQEHFYTDAEIHWFSPHGGLPHWTDLKEKQLACLIQENGQGALFLMFNAGTNGTEFGLPPLPQGLRWRLAVDTSRSAPQDLCAAGEELLLDNSTTYHVGSRSGVILLARKRESVSGGGAV
ncbi:MAG: glycogen debranching enzyme, partial [Candidatus Sulfotelmatobacter sp.]